MVRKKEEVSVGLVLLTILFAIVISFIISLFVISVSEPSTAKDSFSDTGVINVNVGSQSSSGGVIRVDVGG